MAGLVVSELSSILGYKCQFYIQKHIKTHTTHFVVWLFVLCFLEWSNPVVLSRIIIIIIYITQRLFHNYFHILILTIIVCYVNMDSCNIVLITFSEGLKSSYIVLKHLVTQ